MDHGYGFYLDEYQRDVGMHTDDRRGRIECPDSAGFLAAHLPVFDLAAGSVAAFASAIDRGSGHWTLNPERIAASFSSDRLFRTGGEPINGFSVYSGFFAARDGWVRTHGNYPHHRDRLLTILELEPGSSKEAVAQRISELSAIEIEQRAAEIGAIAVRVRTETEWRLSEQCAAARSAPLVSIRASDDGKPRALPTHPRVLDLTRVIAGPIATRALALVGAEVLRIDPPAIPEIGWQHLDSGQGKRSALLDLKSSEGATAFRELLETADVLVTGYRPGALEALIGRDLPAHLIHGRVSAWGWEGPWADRRGFDSIVQAASGISFFEGGEKPGALPAQALDHASGYFLAAGILDALTLRSHDGRGRSVDVSLAGTCTRLLDAPGRTIHPGLPTAPGFDAVVNHGDVTTARPALAEFEDYPSTAHSWGSDPAEWAH
ncbi:CoA transferase [Rhodococcus erythropolis]|uniref:CoA transferase n=1 Tax=Rhodococcus erythropolis TaxID=1833 RepID=UPI001E62995D|nr:MULTISPECIES: CoA transferase [Rhodococcus erythropolis group]MCD2106839.1 CoA transferase [Rhodococcus qingshengii]MCZ4525994.1 CoA transferase [Rhodococcus erythropolis]